MSQCLCSVRQPCPIHKYRPLNYPDVVNHHTIVVRLYHVWSTQKWFATVVRDAIQVQETEGFDTKQEALEQVKL